MNIIYQTVTCSLKILMGVCLVTFSVSNVNAAQQSADSIPVRRAVIKIVKAIAKENRLDAAAVGIEGRKSEQWIRFENLNHAATNLELQALTQYDNAVVRCYAFHALALRKDNAILPILLQHLRDTARISTLSMDLGGYEKAGDYMIEVVTPNYIDLRAYKLTLEQKDLLDSVLLYDKSVLLSAKYNVLHALKPAPQLYARIREIAASENNFVAVLALSRYQNIQDTSILNTYLNQSKALYYAVYAVREFPHPVFYPKLVQIFEKEWSRKAYDYPLWRILYQALAKYPNQNTLVLFERTIQSQDTFRYQTLGTFLQIAITKYPNPLFTELKNQIKLDTYHLEDVAYQMNTEK